MRNSSYKSSIFGLRLSQTLEVEPPYIKNIFNYSKLYKFSNIKIDFFSNKSIYESENTDVFIVGSVFLGDTKLSNYDIQQKYENHNINFANSLDGNFLIVIIDKHNSNVLFITDPLNSKKLFQSRNNDVFYYSNSVWLIPKPSDYLNHNAIQMFLWNGSIANNKCLVKGINVCENGTILKHSNRNEISINQYWQISIETKNIKISEYSYNIKELIDKNIKRALRYYSDVYIPLSGGYDSSAILGFANKYFEKSNIHCFSYYYNGRQGREDCTIAKRQANLLGVSHDALNAELIHSDLEKYFTLNVILGDGISNICEEIGALLQMQYEFSKNSVFLPGEEIFAVRSNFLTRRQFIPAYFRYSSVRSISKELLKLNNQLLDSDDESLQIEYDILNQSIPLEINNQDSLFYFYFTNRLCTSLMTWREKFYSRYCPTSFPLLSKNIVEYVSSVQRKIRSSKKYFSSAVSNTFPTLFNIDRSRSGTVNLNWKKVILSNTEQFMLLDEFDSGEYIPLCSSIYHALQFLNSEDDNWKLDILKHLNRKIMKIIPLYNIYQISQLPPRGELVKRDYMLKLFFHYWKLKDNPQIQNQILKKYNV